MHKSTIAFLIMTLLFTGICPLRSARADIIDDQLNALAGDNFGQNEVAMHSLAMTQDPAVVARVIQALQAVDAQHGWGYINVLGQMGAVATEPLLRAARGDNGTVDVNIMRAIGAQLTTQYKAHHPLDAREVQLLAEQIRVGDDDVRQAVINSIMTVRDDRFFHELLQLAPVDSQMVHAVLAQALASYADDSRAVMVLSVLRHDENPYIRGCALEALGAAKPSARVTDMVFPALHDQDAYVRSTALTVLVRWHDPRAGQLLAEKLHSADKRERLSAVGLYGKYGDNATVDLLLPLLKDADTDLRQAAFDSLMLQLDGQHTRTAAQTQRVISALLDPDTAHHFTAYLIAQRLAGFGDAALPALRAALQSPQVETRRLVASVCTTYSPADFHPQELMLLALRDPDEEVRTDCINRESLYLGIDRRLLPRIIACFDDPSPKVRQQLYEQMGYVRIARYIPPLLARLPKADAHERLLICRVFENWPDAPNVGDALAPLLQDADPAVRQAAAVTLANRQDPRALPQLKLMLQDADADTRGRALAVLQFFGHLDGVTAGRVIALLKDTDLNVRRWAIEDLHCFPDVPGTVEALLPLLHDADPQVRNAAVSAALSMPDPRLEAPLVALLDDNACSDAQISLCSLAAWALAKKADNPLAQRIVTQALHDNMGSGYYQNAVEEIGARAIPWLLTALTDRSPDVQWRAASLLVKLKEPRITPFLIAKLNEAIRIGEANDAAKLLADMPSPAAIAPLLAYLKIDARTAIPALGHCKAKEAVPALCRQLANKDDSLLYETINALGEIGDPAALPALLPLLPHGAHYQREQLIQAVAAIGSREAVPALLQRLDQENDLDLRVCLVQTLGTLRDPRALPALRALSQDEDTETREEAAKAMKLITGG